MAGACLVDDFDNDGLLDVFMSTADAAQGASLLRNRGDGTFEDVSQSAGLGDQVLSLNACHADFDNDGDLDILMLRGAWEVPRRMSLLRNRGNGTFEDVTLAAGLGEPIASQAAGWADFDNDGHVDLYVAGEFNGPHPDARNRGRLYRNRGNGTFEDVASKAGVLNEGGCKGVAWGDYDEDGWPDLYVSNMNQPGRLYHNEVTARSLMSPPPWSVPARATASPAGSGTTTTTAVSTSGSTLTAQASRRSSAISLAGQRPVSGPACTVTSAEKSPFAT